MSLSDIDISNIALATLGASPILSFDEDNKNARMSKVFFASTRDVLLSKFDWPFARGFRELQEVVNTETPTDVTAYQLPNNCLVPRDIHPRGSKDYWEIAKGALYTTKSGDIYLYYTVNDSTTDMFSLPFSNLLALGMAVKMGPAITQNTKLVGLLQKQFMTEQFESWEADANIGSSYRHPNEDPEKDTFVNPDSTSDAEDASRFMETE